MYLGNQPALSYTSFAKQDFTTSATTNYVLDQAVTNANEIALFINFVRQEPTTAYTASGTALTLTGAESEVAPTANIYIQGTIQIITTLAINDTIGITTVNNAYPDKCFFGGWKIA